MPIKNVYLHSSFLNGSKNSDLFKDLGSFDLSDPTSDDFKHLDVIVDFVDKVLKDEKLPGRNKKSYPPKEVYHYHVGPYSQSTFYNSKRLSEAFENHKGATSGPVIHYSLQGSEDLILLGYSPVFHEPFPRINDKNNILRSRIKLTYPTSDLFCARKRLLGDSDADDGEL
ncbi:hypothetical protein [Vibrio methylphosphonaticus]|uniref:hypothetical protein n=1 Tax=Vibrio methylphosphonaticus TaxID=2946866 RepID=UPI00202A1C79|nr:hypothetical protein [Vibrio methylphosphonaticus]MCL9777586.1 hypothetical protein [Vibrio methylphosphonaticus]